MDPRVERSRSTALGAARALMTEGGLDAITPSSVADRSGLGRKTIYRLWPTRASLLHDVLQTSSTADYELTGDLVTDIRTHLRSLAEALTRGPLGMILGALAERAPLDAEMAALRAQLTEEGREPLIALLEDAAETGRLSAETDIDVIATLLEGPVIYEASVRGRMPGVAFIDAVIATVIPSTNQQPLA